MKRKFNIIIAILMAAVMATSCSSNADGESYEENTNKAFLEMVNGNMDVNHLWMTAVKLKVNVVSDAPVRLWALSYGDNKVIYDYKELEKGGEVVMTVPQCNNRNVVLRYTSGLKVGNINIQLTGNAEQSVDIAVNNNASSAAAKWYDWNTTRAYAPGLYGESVIKNMEYTVIPMTHWTTILDLLDLDGKNPKLRNETVNFELRSKGKFVMNFISGFTSEFTPRIFGYYYHTPGTYKDLTFVDICETHIYDWLDGKAKVQYELDNSGVWIDANFDKEDKPNDDSGANSIRRGDDVYNILRVCEEYGSRVTGVRGLSIVIDVPKDMHLGFYLKHPSNKNISQYSTLTTTYSVQRENLPSPFVPLSFTAEALNVNNGKDLHRAWVHEFNGYLFMGMEDNLTGGDLDCNDVVFGMWANSAELVLPEVIIPDADLIRDQERMLTWTIGYEDRGREADFDFNDVVIKVAPDYNNATAKVSILAAGTTERMYLHYDGPEGDVNLGEVHQLLGRGLTPVNTTSSVANVPFADVIEVAWPNSFTMAEDAKRFYIEVKRGTCEGCSDVITLATEPGQMPEAICVAGDWRWPKEGTAISNAYTMFNEWSNDYSRTSVWGWHEVPKMGLYVE